MTRTEISKFLWSRLWLTVLLSGFFTAILTLVLFGESADSLEGHQALTIAVLAGIFWVFLLTICSITVFFNLDPAIANNRVYNFLAYYFIPLIAAISVAVLTLTSETWWYCIAITAPFFVVHTCFYIQFNKRLAAAK